MSMTKFTRLANVRRTLVLGCVVSLTAGCAGGAFQAQPQDIPRLEQRLGASPGDAALQAQLGAAYFNAGRYEDARSTLEAAVAAGAQEPAAQLYLGLTQEKLQAWGEAREAYTRYLATNAPESGKRNVRSRLALVARNELRQQARALLDREQQLAEQPPTPNSIAVMPFRASGLSDELAPLQTALAEMIITDLGFTQLRSIERVRVSSIVDEMRLGLGGVTTEETSTRVGRLLRAQHVVQGQLNSGGGQQLAVSANVLNTASRTAGNALTQQGELDAIFDMEKQLVFGILAEAGYTPSPAERERINENRVANLIAFLAYGRGLEALDRGNYAEARAQFEQATRADPSFGAAQTQRTEATELSAAETTTPEQAAQSVAPPPPPTTSVMQSVVAQVNPSPATTMVSAPESSGQGSTPPPPSRTNPTSEPTQQPTTTQAATAKVTITILNPTKGK